MKKTLSVFAAFAICTAAFGAVLQSFKNVQPGDFTVGGAGKLVSVDVFSTESTGSVSIARVFSMTHYTNAVDSTSEIVTNVVETKNYDDVFYRGDGIVFTNIGEQYSTTFWEASATGHIGCVAFNEPSSIWWYLTAWNAETGEYDFTNGIVIRGAQDDDYLRFGTGADTVEFSRAAIYRDSTFSTNVVTVVTTNSVTPVRAYDLVITNQVLNGACENGVYHGVPASGIWLFTNDKINFSGTATGGELRIVIE